MAICATLHHCLPNSVEQTFVGLHYIVQKDYCSKTSGGKYCVSPRQFHQFCQFVEPPVGVFSEEGKVFRRSQIKVSQVLLLLIRAGSYMQHLCTLTSCHSYDFSFLDVLCTQPSSLDFYIWKLILNFIRSANPTNSKMYGLWTRENKRHYFPERRYQWRPSREMEACQNLCFLINNKTMTTFSSCYSSHASSSCSLPHEESFRLFICTMKYS